MPRNDFINVDGTVNFDNIPSTSQVANTSIKQYGAKGDGATDNYLAFNKLISSIGSSNAEVYLPSGTYIIGTNLTIPSNISLVFANGAILSPNTGITITINGYINAPISQIFGGVGTIGGIFKNKEIIPQWFGAKGDGINDDTIAINNAIIVCANAGGGIVFFPVTIASYIISSTIMLGNGTSTSLSTINGIKVRGESVYSTKIKWNGVSGGTMVKIAGISQGNSLGDLTLDGNNVAGIGCNVVSGQFAQWGDLQIQNCATTLQLTTLTTVPNGQTGNTIGNLFGKLMLKPSTGTVSNQSYGLVLDGANASTGDSNNNYFPNIHIWAQTNYITSVRLGFADFNKFGIVVCFNAPSLIGCYGLHLDGTVVVNFPNANQFDLTSFSQTFYQTGTPGLNYVNFYDTVDGNLSIPNSSGICGYAQNPNDVSLPPIPFGQGAPVNVQQSVNNQLVTTTSATSILNLGQAHDGLYQVNLYLRVITATTTVTAIIYSGDETGVQYAFLQAQKANQSATSGTILNVTSLATGSYVGIPFVFRYNEGAVQKPILQLTVGTINQVYCSASIIKIG